MHEPHDAPTGAPEEWRRDPRLRTPYSPITTRPPLRLPGGARVAVWVVPNVEHYQWAATPYAGFNVFSGVPYPDVSKYATREHAPRAGFWRMAKIFDETAARPTVALNLAVLELYPQIRDAMVERGWEIMCHGFYNTELVFDLGPAAEREWFARAVASVREHTAQELKGLLGPAIAATVNTPDLMVEAGLTYHADWEHDEQPTPVLTTSGRLVSVPYNDDVNDGLPGTLSLTRLVSDWKLQFDRLWAEGEVSGRVMCIPLHPFVSGQPHGDAGLRHLFDYIDGHDGVWWATGSEIADHFLAEAWDEQLDYATLVSTREGSHAT